MPCTCIMCTCTTAVSKSTLICVTPLGRPRAIYKCNIECRFGDADSKWPNNLGGQGQWLPCSIPADTDLLIKAQIYYKFLCGQARFPRILSQNDLEDQCQWPPIFNTRQDYPRMRVWCKFSDFDTNLWWASVRITLISNNSWSKWPKGQGQWPPLSAPAESILWCIFGANLVIPDQKCAELTCRQHSFPKTLSQNSQNYVERQGQSSTSWRVIVRTRWSLRTGGQADGRMQATTIPPSAWKGKG